jgi:hypothetical protein
MFKQKRFNNAVVFQAREALFQLNSLLKKGIRKTNMALAVSQFQLDAVFISHARAKFVERQS